MHALVDVLLVVAGIVATAVVLDAAVRTFVVPRGTVVLFTVVVFLAIRRAFDVFASPRRTYEARDRVMAFYAPVALLALPFVSMLVVFGAFACIFEGIEDFGWRSAIMTSGSSLLTLGFERPPDLAGRVRRVQRGDDRAGNPRTADRVPPDHLQHLLPARGRGDRSRDPGRYPAHAPRDDGARAPHRLLVRDGRLLERVDDLVHGGSGDPHFVRLALVLPVAEPASLVGHGRGRGARHRLDSARRARHLRFGPGAAVHPIGLPRAARGRGLLRLRL